MPSFLKKPRAIFWFIESFGKKHFRYIIFGCLLSFFISLYWYSGFFVTFRGFFKPENSIGIVGQYNLTNLPLSIQRKISFGLTKIMDNDEATSGASSFWQIRDNGKSYEFNLNPRLRWHDGSRLRSFDINYRFKDVEIVALGDRVVQFKLKNPYSSMAQILGQPLFKKGLIGLGDYKVLNLSWASGFLEKIVLVNLTNHDNKLIYKFYNNEEEILSALKLKKISRAEGFSNLNLIKNNADFKIDSSPNYHNILTLFFNTKKDPLSEKTIRFGLSYAIPDDVSAGFESADGPIPKTSWFYNPNLKSYSYNEELANKYLKDLVEKKPSTESAEFKIRLDTVTKYKEVAQKIVDAWNNIGIKTTLRETDTVLSDYDVFLAPIEVSSNPDQYFLWHSTQDGNITNLKSPRIDKVLEDARKAPDSDIMKKKYQEFQKYLVEEDPALFLFYTNNYTISRL